MKCIGLIGGMSWESTATYYRVMNQEVRKRRGGQASAELLLYSVDFQKLEKMQHAGRWDLLAQEMVDAGHRLKRAGAEALMLCTNTMHKVADQLESEVGLRLIHIADATGERLRSAGVGRVGLLGTKFTMEEDFYKSRLKSRFAVEAIVPESADRTIIHDVIYQELCVGKISEGSRKQYLRIIETLVEKGAQAIILGCTEIGLLIDSSHTKLPLFDTATIHAEKGVDYALTP